MFFNIEKCETNYFSLNRNTIDFDYTLKNVFTNRVNEVSDLGLIFDSKCSFNPHVDNSEIRFY